MNLVIVLTIWFKLSLFIIENDAGGKMPWEKTFDTDEALEKAMAVFWSKGYDSASLADLIKATGVNKGSFYNAFGSKKQLFVQTLQKYEREHRKDVLAQLELREEPKAAILSLFDEIIKQSLNDQEKKGCFIVNTALELHKHTDDIQQAIKKSLHGTELFFQKQIELGIQSGSIPQSVDPVREAKGLLALLVGLRVLARGVFEQESLTVIKLQAANMIQ